MSWGGQEHESDWSAQQVPHPSGQALAGAVGTTATDGQASYWWVWHHVAIVTTICMIRGAFVVGDNIYTVYSWRDISTGTSLNRIGDFIFTIIAKYNHDHSKIFVGGKFLLKG